MDLQKKSNNFASEIKSKVTVKKPPAPPPRKSSVPTALSSSDKGSYVVLSMHKWLKYLSILVSVA